MTDLHRHFIDHLTILSREGRGVLRRVDEVFDCWFESGSMPYAQLHYPFENTKFFEENFPADFVAEGALTSPKALLVVIMFIFMKILFGVDVHIHVVWALTSTGNRILPLCMHAEGMNLHACRPGSDERLVLHADGAVHRAL